MKHRVSTSEEETLCPICGRKHGFGDLNVPGPVHPVMHTMQNNPEHPIFHKSAATSTKLEERSRGGGG